LLSRHCPAWWLSGGRLPSQSPARALVLEQNEEDGPTVETGFACKELTGLGCSKHY